MAYRCRTDSIHSEIELLAREFDAALEPQKNERAERLLIFMHNHPNAELWRALPIAKKNLFCEKLNVGVRRKCAKMLGEMGSEASRIGGEKIREVAELLVKGLAGNDHDLRYSCLTEIRRIAMARKKLDLDCVVGPVVKLVEKEAAEGFEDFGPGLLETALDTLGAITPKKRECLDLLREAKHSVIAEKLKELERTTDRDERESIQLAWQPCISSISRTERKWAEALKIRDMDADAKQNPMRKAANGGKGAPARRIIRVP